MARTTLNSLALGGKRSPRPGDEYVLVEEDGKAVLVGRLRPPTDALVRQFDRFGGEAAQSASKLQRLITRKVDAERRARQAATEPAAGLDLAAIEAELDDLDRLIREADPTNPDSPTYYVRQIIRKADLVLDVKDADGNPAMAEGNDQVLTLVADAAVQDWTRLAFLSASKPNGS